MKKKFFIIAGEASGDVLGAKLIAEIKAELVAKNEQADFIGVGGKLMQEQGLLSIFPMEELSIMGFLEVLPHIPKLLKLIKKTAEANASTGVAANTTPASPEQNTQPTAGGTSFTDVDNSEFS